MCHGEKTLKRAQCFRAKTCGNIWKIPRQRARHEVYIHDATVFPSSVEENTETQNKGTCDVTPESTLMELD